MELIKHDSAESIIAAYWHFEENEMTLDDFLKSEGHGFSEKGEAVSYTGADELAGMKASGF